MKFGQLIEYTNIFLEKPPNIKLVEKLFPDPFLRSQIERYL